MTQKVKCRFEFSVRDSWKSGESACWTECPFSPLIGLGHTCKFLTTKELQCASLDNKYKTLLERDCTVEVRHGKWQACFEDWRKQIEGDECSVCGFQHYGTSITHYHYCPNCGARMDGKE